MKTTTLLTFILLLYAAAVSAQCSVNVINSTNVVCYGLSSGSATILASGGTSPYDYSWSGTTQTGATITGLAAGTYCVTVTDALTCTATTCVTISEPSEITATLNSTNISCLGGSDGSITVVASGGAGGYTYLWYKNGIPIAPSVTTPTITGLGMGTYYVVVTDLNGCMTTSSSVIITQPATSVTANANVTSNYNGTGVSCNGGFDGQAMATGSGGTPGYTYLWGPSANNLTTAIATGLVAGTHCVTVTDVNGCFASDCVIVTEPSAILTTTAYISNVSCFGNADGIAIVTSNGGAFGYTYLWGPSANNLTTAAATGLVAGTHCVTITDINACFAINCVTITQPATPLTVNANVTSNYNGAQISCNGFADGAATANASGGTGAVTYLWGPSTGNVTLVTATGLAAGTHCVTVTDANGCEDSACVTLIDPMQVSASIFSSTDPLCNGNFNGTAMAVGSGGIGGYSYQWNGATGVQTTSTATNLGANISYCVTITDANGCGDDVCVTLTEPSAVSITASSTTHVSCFGGADGNISLSVGGGVPGYTFSWDNGISSISPTATGLAAGVYCVTVSDINLCEATTCVTVAEPSALNITFSAPDTICSGTNTTITVTPTGGTPGYTYLWYDASVLNTITGISSGNHCVTVQDASGCSATACKQINTINFETTIQDNWTGENPHIFMGDSYNIQTTSTHPVVSYNWTPATGLSCTTCANPIAAPAVTTTYYLTTLNTSGCVGEDSITIEVFTPNTSHIYIDVAPDSTVQYNYTPSALWTNGSMFNMAILLPPTLNYGVATLDTNIHQVQYMSNGTAPEVTDTIMYLICNQICDTMYFYITTASCVWAGDTDDDGIANNMDLLPIGLHYGATGTTRANASINYTCQPSRNWNVGTLGNPSVDIKHIDCDGNGTINDIDTNAIILNWAQTHVKNLSTNTTGIEIYIDTITAMPGQTVSLPIILGNSLNPVAGYGVAFTIHYDVMGVDTNSVSIDFSNSWLGTIGSNMIGISKDFYSTGKIELAMTRTNHNSVSGGGRIGQINFTIKDDVLPKSAYLRLDFEITDVRFIDHLGDTIPTLPLPSQVLVVDNWLNHSTIEKTNKINVFPNPTGSLLNIQSLNENIEMVQVLDLTGKIVLEQSSIHSLQNILDMNSLAAGIYILTVQTGSGVEMVRVIKN